MMILLSCGIDAREAFFWAVGGMEALPNVYFRGVCTGDACDIFFAPGALNSFNLRNMESAVSR